MTDLATLLVQARVAAGPCLCGDCTVFDGASHTPKPPSQLRTYDLAKVRVTFRGVELVPGPASFRYSPRRERRRTLRVARRARKLRRGWA